MTASLYPRFARLAAQHSNRGAMSNRMAGAASHRASRMIQTATSKNSNYHYAVIAGVVIAVGGLAANSWFDYQAPKKLGLQRAPTEMFSLERQPTETIKRVPTDAASK